MCTYPGKSMEKQLRDQVKRQVSKVADMLGKIEHREPIKAKAILRAYGEHYGIEYEMTYCHLGFPITHKAKIKPTEAGVIEYTTHDWVKKQVAELMTKVAEQITPPAPRKVKPAKVQVEEDALVMA